MAKTFTKNQVTKNLEAFGGDKSHLPKGTQIYAKNQLRMWKYIASKLGNKDSVTIPDSVINEITKDK